MISPILEKLCEGQNLSEEEIELIFSSMMKGELSDIQSSSFLTALKIKKPSADEIFFASNVLLNNLDDVPNHSMELLDLCGTGGDSKSTLNVSTISSLLLASLGIKIAKHGNRSVSSKVGSADLIEKLGLSMDVDLNENELNVLFHHLDPSGDNRITLGEFSYMYFNRRRMTNLV